MDVCEAILSLLDAIMLYHGTYFKRGVKRTFEELAQFPLNGNFSEDIRKISKSGDVSELRSLEKSLILYAENYTSREIEKAAPTKEQLSGSYEEMYSNWRNKVEEAAVNNDTYSSFVNMCCLQYMISDISSDVNIGTYDIMEAYNPDCPEDNVRIYDEFLADYEKIYKEAGIAVNRFSDVDKFYGAYVGGDDL